MDFIDSRELGTFEGFELVAYEVYDEDSRPEHTGTIEEGGYYSHEDIEAWREDQWYYAGVIVKAYRNNVPLGEASIYGIEAGDYWGDPIEQNMTRHEDTGQPYDAFASGYGPTLIAEAISDAKATLSGLTIP